MLFTYISFFNILHLKIEHLQFLQHGYYLKESLKMTL